MQPGADKPGDAPPAAAKRRGRNKKESAAAAAASNGEPARAVARRGRKKKPTEEAQPDTEAAERAADRATLEPEMQEEDREDGAILIAESAVVEAPARLEAEQAAVVRDKSAAMEAADQQEVASVAGWESGGEVAAVDLFEPTADMDGPVALADEARESAAASANDVEKTAVADVQQELAAPVAPAGDEAAEAEREEEAAALVAGGGGSAQAAAAVDVAAAEEVAQEVEEELEQHASIAEQQAAARSEVADNLEEKGEGQASMPVVGLEVAAAHFGEGMEVAPESVTAASAATDEDDVEELVAQQGAEIPGFVEQGRPDVDPTEQFGDGDGGWAAARTALLQQEVAAEQADIESLRTQVALATEIDTCSASACVFHPLFAQKTGAGGSQGGGSGGDACKRGQGRGIARCQPIQNWRPAGIRFGSLHCLVLLVVHSVEFDAMAAAKRVLSWSSCLLTGANE